MVCCMMKSPVEGSGSAQTTASSSPDSAMVTGLVRLQGYSPVVCNTGIYMMFKKAVCVNRSQKPVLPAFGSPSR